MPSRERSVANTREGENKRSTIVFPLFSLVCFECSCYVKTVYTKLYMIIKRSFVPHNLNYKIWLVGNNLNK